MSKQLRKSKRLRNTGDRYWVHHVVPVRRTKKEEYECSDLFWKWRISNREKENDPGLLEVKMNYLRWQLDTYLRNNVFRQQLTFGHFLKAYLERLGRPVHQLAEEIDEPVSLLEDLMKDEVLPENGIFYKLEVHSNALIPAEQWNRTIFGRKRMQFVRDSYLIEVARLSVRNAINAEPWGVKKKAGHL